MGEFAMSMSSGSARWLVIVFLVSAGLAGAPAAAIPVGSTTLVGPVYTENGLSFTIDVASNLIFTPKQDGISDADLGDRLGPIELDPDPDEPGYAGPDTLSLAVDLEYVVGSSNGAPTSFPDASLVSIRVWVDGVEYSSLGPAPSVVQNPVEPGALQYTVHVVGDSRFEHGALLTLGGNLQTYEDIAQFDFAAENQDPSLTTGTLAANVSFAAIAAPIPVPLPVIGLITGLGALALVSRRRTA